jgi:hypothetical protein
MASQHNVYNLTNQATLEKKRESGEIARVADLTEKNKLKMRELLKEERKYNILRNRNREDLIKINQEIKPYISTIIEEFINFKLQSNISSDETKIIDLIYTNVKTLLTFKLIDFKIKEKIDLFDIILKNLKSLELKINVLNLSEIISTLKMLYIKIIREFNYSKELKKNHTQLLTELRQSFKLNGGGNPSMNNITEKYSLYTKAEALLLELNIKYKNKYYNGTYKDINGKLVKSYRENDLILYSPENIQNLITVIETSYKKKSLFKKKVVSSNKPELIKILKTIYTLKLQEKSLGSKSPTNNLTTAQLELELAELDINSTTNNLTAAELAQLAELDNNSTNNLTAAELAELAKLAELDNNSNTNNLTAADLAKLEKEVQEEMNAERDAEREAYADERAAKRETVAAERAAKRETVAAERAAKRETVAAERARKEAERAAKKLTKKSQKSTAGGSLKKTKKVKKSNKKSKTLKK